MEFASNNKEDILNNAIRWDPLSLEHIYNSVFRNDTLYRDIRDRKFYISKLEGKNKITEERQISEKKPQVARTESSTENFFERGNLGTINSRRARVNPPISEENGQRMLLDSQRMIDALNAYRDLEFNIDALTGTITSRPVQPIITEEVNNEEATDNEQGDA